MSRTARLLEIAIKVQTRSRFTVQEMADEFGVSRRTMLRDLHALSEMGVPLAASPGPYGGYSLLMGRRLFPLSLTADEAIGIVLSYEAFLQYAQSPFSAQSLSAVTKLRNAIPPDVVRELDRIHERVVVVEPERSYQAPFLTDVLQAALDGVHLDVEYDSRTRRTRRRIYPFGLYASHGFWYCVCHDYRRDTNLVLRVDRVLFLQRVEGVDRPPDLTPREWLRTYREDGENQVPLRARVTRSGAKSFELVTLLGEIPLNEEGEGIIELDVPLAEIDYFAAHFLPLGRDLVVESPPELIEAMRQKAKDLVAQYAGE